MVHGRHHPAMATNPQGRPAFGYSTPDQVYPISDSTRIWPSQNTGSSTNSPLTDHRRTPPGLSDCQPTLTDTTDRVEVETVINGFSSSSGWLLLLLLQLLRCSPFVNPFSFESYSAVYSLTDGKTMCTLSTALLVCWLLLCSDYCCSS